MLRGDVHKNRAAADIPLQAMVLKRIFALSGMRLQSLYGFNFKV
jgi:hypothetical protein